MPPKSEKLCPYHIFMHRIVIQKLVFSFGSTPWSIFPTPFLSQTKPHIRTNYFENLWMKIFLTIYLEDFLFPAQRKNYFVYMLISFQISWKSFHSLSSNCVTHRHRDDVLNAFSSNRTSLASLVQFEVPYLLWYQVASVTCLYKVVRCWDCYLIG